MYQIGYRKKEGNKMSDSHNKYALVTGANRGLGLGFVNALLEKGYFVFAGTRTKTPLDTNDKNVQQIPLDIEDDESIKSAVNLIANSGVHIDLLINNAGINKRSHSVGDDQLVNKLDKLNRKSLLHMFNTNTVGPIMLISYALSILNKQDCFIINISSGRASFENDSPTGNYGYRASKIALNMMTKASILDLPKGVKTFSVHPGLVRTDMYPQGAMEPIEAARKIIDITQSWDDSKNGAFLDNDGNYFPYNQ